jgi:hypothetical protein
LQKKSKKQIFQRKSKDVGRQSKDCEVGQLSEQTRILAFFRIFELFRWLSRTLTPGLLILV